jgi:hypothetical protein
MTASCRAVEMRVMFVLYLTAICAGLVYLLAIGLRHG